MLNKKTKPKNKNYMKFFVLHFRGGNFVCDLDILWHWA